MEHRAIRLTQACLLVALAVWYCLSTTSPQVHAENHDNPKHLTSSYQHYRRDRHTIPVLGAGTAKTGAVPEATHSVPTVFEREQPADLQAAAQHGPGIVICGGGLGGTIWDIQHNDDNQQMIATLGSSSGSFVHFAWAQGGTIPSSFATAERSVAINCFNQTTGLGLANCGFQLDVGGTLNDAHGGFPTVESVTGDLESVAYQARAVPEQPSGHFSTFISDAAAPCFNIFSVDELTASTTPEAVWPHMRVDLGGGSAGQDVYHVCAHPPGGGGFTDEIFYWRRVGGFGSTWEGPVVLDLTADGPLNYHVAVDPTSDKVAVFYEKEGTDGLLDVGYVESVTNGADWIAADNFPTPIGTPFHYIRDYSGVQEFDPQAWLQCHGEYDFAGVKHCVWIEQAYADLDSQCRLKHWDEVHGITTIKEALGWSNGGENGVRDLWLAQPNLGFGNGLTTCTDGPGDKTNFNYVYVTYTQYGGPTAVEAADFSVNYQQNAEIYLAVSNDGGDTWAPSENLTLTKTPGCDGTPGSECASECEPSLAHIVNDSIHIQYIEDLDAGDAAFGNGTWTLNPVMYYRIEGGTDAQYLCPDLAPVMSTTLSNADPDCVYHTTCSPPGTVTETLTITNLGNIPLNGFISTSAPWLSVSPSGALPAIAAGASSSFAVTMSAALAGACPTAVSANIIITGHNDPNLPATYLIPVTLVIVNGFICPAFTPMVTANPLMAPQRAQQGQSASGQGGGVTLEISNVGRVGDKTKTAAGMARLDPTVGDSSYSILDGSLIIGVPPSPDTLVYRNLIGAGNGQPGFLATSDIDIDDSQYGTFQGEATATTHMVTVDSSIGVQTDYIFPQSTDSADFVLIKYTLYTADTSQGGSSNLTVGQATDFDVMPSLHDVDSIQPGAQNTGHLVTNYNFVYQEGVDSSGYVVVGDRTATRFKAGITDITCGPAPRAWVAPSDPWLDAHPGGGFSDGYLYREMVKSGFEVFPPSNPDPEEDLHAVMVFRNGVTLGKYDTLGSGHEQIFTMAYVSSNKGTDDADLMSSVRKAWKYAFGWEMLPDTVHLPAGTPAALILYSANGSHEDGISGGCCGCQVSKVSGSTEITIAGGEPGGCGGALFVSQSQQDATYSAIIGVIDMCAQYSDQRSITVIVGAGGPTCDCPYQSDFNADGFLDATDLNDLIDALFFGGTDPQDPDCPTTRGDFNNDGFADAVDLNDLINHLFFAGNPPCDPCNPVQSTCGP